MGSCGSCVPVRRGGTCPSVTGRGRPPTSGCAVDGGRHLGPDPRPGRREGRRGRQGRVDVQSMDSSNGAGPPARGWAPGKRGLSPADWVEALAVDGEGLGRSRGGLTSKIHLAVDGRGLPMSIMLTAGQAGDNPQLLPLLDQINVGRDGPAGPARAHKGDRRQGLLASLDPRGRCASAGSRSPAPNAATRSSIATPKAPAAAGHQHFDAGRLRRTQRRRALLQPAQTIPRPGHPLRQTGRLLPLRAHHRHDRVVAPHDLQDTP